MSRVKAGGGLGLRPREHFGGEETDVGKETRDQDEIQVPDCTPDLFFAAKALPLALEGLVCMFLEVLSQRDNALSSWVPATHWVAPVLFCYATVVSSLRKVKEASVQTAITGPSEHRV